MSAAAERQQHLQSAEAFLRRHITQVVAALPMSVPEDQLKRAVAQLRVAFSHSPLGSGIFDCTAESVARAVVMSALTGLYPGAHNPDVDIIPRRNNRNGGALELNWQISYRGYMRLARRSPGYDLQAFVVFEGDDFDVQYGSNPMIVHRPIAPIRNSGDLADPARAWAAITHVYPLVFSPLGTRFEVLDKGRIQARRERAKDQSVWDQWPIEQVIKTACRYAGQRELFPCDDPTRYALRFDTVTEIGRSDAALDFGASLEEPSNRTEALAARLSAGPVAVGAPAAAMPEMAREGGDLEARVTEAQLQEIREGLEGRNRWTLKKVLETFKVEDLTQLTRQRAQAVLGALKMEPPGEVAADSKTPQQGTITPPRLEGDALRKVEAALKKAGLPPEDLGDFLLSVEGKKPGELQGAPGEDPQAFLERCLGAVSELAKISRGEAAP